MGKAFEDMTMKQWREHLAKGGSFVAEEGGARFEVREDRAFPEDEELYVLIRRRPGATGFGGAAGAENLPVLLSTYQPDLGAWEAVGSATSQNGGTSGGGS